MILGKHKKNDVNNKLNKSTIFISVGVNVFIFLLLFIPMYTRYWAIFLLIVDVIFILFHKDIKIRLNTTIILWYIFIGVGIFGLFFSNKNSSEGFQFIFAQLLFLLTYALLLTNNNWCKFTIDILFWIAAFFVLGSIIQIIFPGFTLYINKLHINEAQLSMATGLARDGYITGFTHQTGVNGFITSIFMSVVFLKIFIYKEKKTKVFLTVLYLFAFFLLFMTGKRGFILFNVIIFLFLITKFTKYKIRSFIPIIMFIFILFIIFNYTDAGLKILRRTAFQLDITSGRAGMNIIMLEDFLSNPIKGKGTYTTIDAVNAYHGHNIYLQVLREHGLLGFIPYIYVLLHNLFSSIKTLNYVKKDNSYEYVVGFSLYMQILFLLWGFTGNPLYDMYSLIVYFVSIAIVPTIKNNIKYENLYLNKNKLTYSNNMKF